MARYIRLLFGVLLAATMASAMVPRMRRATEEEVKPSGAKKQEICDASTVCAWTVYNLDTKRIDYSMKNDYCICAPGKECIFFEDDISIGAYIHRCQVPPPTTTTEADSDSES